MAPATGRQLIKKNRHPSRSSRYDSETNKKNRHPSRSSRYDSKKRRLFSRFFKSIDFSIFYNFSRGSFHLLTDNAHFLKNYRGSTIRYRQNVSI